VIDYINSHRLYQVEWSRSKLELMCWQFVLYFIDGFQYLNAKIWVADRDSVVHWVQSWKGVFKEESYVFLILTPRLKRRRQCNASRLELVAENFFESVPARDRSSGMERRKAWGDTRRHSQGRLSRGEAPVGRFKVFQFVRTILPPHRGGNEPCPS